MAELEAGEFAVSEQGETMHVIGKAARLGQHCADRGGTLKKMGVPFFFPLKLIELNLAMKPQVPSRRRNAPTLRVNTARYLRSSSFGKRFPVKSRNDGNEHTEQLLEPRETEGKMQRT